jgi:hypothetical protein
MTHVQSTLPNLGFQLWGDQGLVNEKFYGNKPACIEPNVEILEFMMKEHDPNGIPDEIQNISDMVEMALLIESMQDLVDKTPGLDDTEMQAGPQCNSNKNRLPRENAGNDQTLDPCIYRLTSMEIHEMLGHMGGKRGFPPSLNMEDAIPLEICEQCVHERHIMESRQQCSTAIGCVWNGTVMYFGISAQAGSRYAAVFENLESGQLETFTMTEKSDFGDDLSTFAQELRDDPRFVACTGNTSMYEPRNECHMFSHVNLEMNKDWNTADATFLNMMKEQDIHIIRNDAERHGNDLNGTIPYV